MIGITERGDAHLNTAWVKWVSDNQPAILITKNPLGLCSHLIRLDNPNVIVHATITGYGASVLEPNVVPFEEAIIGLKALRKIIDPERIVLRIDPVIPTEKGIEVALNVLKNAQKIGLFRVRISFLDLYNHVRKRFINNEIDCPWNGFHAPVEQRKAAFDVIQKESKTVVEICGEPNFDCTGCVSAYDCKILNVDPSKAGGYQRENCACLALKKELLSDKQQCWHKCLYCYWKNEGE